MNQKFLEVAKGVDDIVIATGNVPGSPEFNLAFVQKYAETLIQECINICEKGAETQTTSQGAAILIRQRFDM
jgi:hypothetical protein